MKLQTEISLEKADFSISYSDTIVSLGSCFAENIGNELQSRKFNIDNNPFGIIYNPASILQSVELLTGKRDLDEKDFFSHNHLLHSWKHHGKFSHEDEYYFKETVFAHLKQSRETFAKANILLITFGTARVYRLKSSGRIVANCHKVPAKEFLIEQLELSNIIEQYSELLKSLFANNKNLKIIFTVSPIRHWKDGAHDNQISKAVLLLAVEQLQKQFEQVCYFPAYEIMLDQLRDYRFYAEDMLHPSSTAVDYIREKFCECYFSGETLQLQQRVEKLLNAVNHRPFNPRGEDYMNHVRSTIKKCKQTEADTGIDFSIEIGQLSERLQ